MTARIAILAILAIWLAAFVNNANGQSVITRWPANNAVARPMVDLVKAFQSRAGADGGLDAGIDDKASVGRFADKDEPFSVVCLLGSPTADEKKVLARRFSRGSAKPEIRCIGQRRIGVIVNEASPVRSLSLPALGKMLSEEGKKTTWREFGGGSSAIRCHVESRGSSSVDLLRRKCMVYEEQADGYVRRGWRTFRDDLDENIEVAEIIKRVRADRNGIGFVPYTGQPLKGVRVVAIGDTDKGPSIALGDGLSFQDGYALSEPLMVYVHSKAPPLAREFVNYACGAQGSAILEKHGFITPHRLRQAQAQARLDAAKSGKGVRLAAAGPNGLGLSDLVDEYVKAKTPVQMTYLATESDVAAVAAFVRIGAGATTMPAEAVAPPKTDVRYEPPAASMPATAPADAPRAASSFVTSGEKELLFLADKPGEVAMKLHGEKWNAMGPGGTSPTEYTLAGRAVAIIVNPANKLESLTLGQIQAVFGGEVDDWAIIGGTELSAPAGPSGKSKDIPIHAFGLRARRPATEIFEKECLLARKFRRVTRKRDTAGAVAAVSMDPRAIAFVDLTAIPGIGPASLAGDFAAAGQNVKVLAIQIGIGEKAKIIQPTPENIRNAMYPLSQRLFLYVHPKAGDTAKDFAKFIATCGGSEASPYADTVKAVMETYQKHGLIPLADAAIERVTKDAMAAAAAKAKAEAAKPKGKR